MNTNLLFSVIIPTYNQSKYLERAINSVLLQKKNYEIIVIDNFSSDDTEEVVKKYKGNYLKYIKSNNFGIIGKSRNIGIENSIAPWIAFLDSDDEWYENKLNILEEFIKKYPEYDVITNDEEIFYEETKKKKIFQYGPYTNNFYKKLILDGNCISTSATIVKKSFLRKNKILFSEKKEFASVEDYDFFLNLALNHAKFKFFHQVLGKHLYHKKSFSRNFEKYHNAIEKLLNYHINYVQKFSNNKKKLLKRVSSNLSIIKSNDEIKFNKSYLKGLVILTKGFFQNPIYMLNILIKKLVKS
tara:strand:+ start:940 stop:1836 length:897 start_codon:yes stop_codon:yes gene_type:complete